MSVGYDKPSSVTELIAACGFQTEAPGVGQYSFSNALIKVLRAFALKNVSFSVSELFSAVLSQLRNTPHRHQQTGPVHSLLTSQPDKRHIMIEPNAYYGRSNTAQPTRADNWEEPKLSLAFCLAPGVQMNGPDIAAWTDWIMKAPEGAVGVELL